MARLDVLVALLLGGLAAASLRVTVLLSLTALVALALRRRSAAMTHFIWMVGLVASLAVVALPAVLPAWRVIPIIPSAPLSVGVITTGPQVTVEDEHSARPATEVASSARSIDTRLDPISSSRRVANTSRRSWRTLALALWGFGALLVLVRYGRSRATLASITRRSAALTDEAAGVMATQIAAKSGLSRMVRVLASGEVDVPLTWGIVRPRILLPAEAEEWNPTRLSHVLHHELAHVWRWDAACQLVAQAVSALFWFHPLVWYATREVRRIRERACDDHVLALGANRSDYAADLLAMVRRHGSLSPAALAMARRSHFEGRLLALLDPTLSHGLPSWRWSALIVAAGVICTVPVAALCTTSGLVIPHVRPPAIGPVRASLPSPTDARTAEVSAVPRRPGPLAAGAVDDTDLFSACGPTTDIHDHQSADGPTPTWTVRVQDGACLVALDALGQIHVNDQATALTSISAGGHFDLALTVHGAVTEVRAAPAAGGLTYSFVTDGHVTPFSPTGAAWLTKALLVLDRHTAFAVDERWSALSHGGTASVFDEIGRLRTDHARDVYLGQLLADTPLGDTDLVRFVQATLPMRGGTVSLFRRLATKYRLAPPVVVVMLQVASAARSNEDRAQILLVVADHGELTTPLRAQSLAAAATLEPGRLRDRVIEAFGRRGH
jgi:beta-lactamase regulating signal transducer with metallopeptidase domain